MLAQRALLTDPEPQFHGELIDFDPVWFEPKATRPGGPPVTFGAMGPLGIKYAAQWADGWMPVDVAMQDIAKEVKNFRQSFRLGSRRSFRQALLTSRSMGSRQSFRRSFRGGSRRSFRHRLTTYNRASFFTTPTVTYVH